MGRHELAPIAPAGVAAVSAHRVRPGKGEVWNASSLDWPSAHGAPPAPPLRADTAAAALRAAVAERARMLAVLRLRKQLNRMVLRREGAGGRKTRVPVMAFDRWQMRCKCVAASSGADPVVPQPAASAPADPDLVADIVKAGCTAADAAAVALELGGLSRREADGIASAPLSAAARVVVQRHKHSIDVVFAQRGGGGGGGGSSGGGGGGESKVLKLNPAHYDKLRAMYRRASASASGSSDAADEEERFHSRLYAVLARYHGVQGHGFQAAVGEDAFAALRAHFGVSLECFASPLNCRYAAHCSAYADTDGPFGSLGSFFDFHPARGSFEANPPFEEVVMARCVEHITALLQVSFFYLPLHFTRILLTV
jgi:hypothetical protein